LELAKTIGAAYAVWEASPHLLEALKGDITSEMKKVD
jgi:hypothetical protein